MERIMMRHAREIIRLKSSCVSAHEIARRLGMARSTVRETLKRTETAGLSWPLPDDMTDGALEAALYASRRSKRGHRRVAEPDWASVHRELKRKYVTLLILWDEYIAANPGGYSYSRFCELYRSFEKTVSVTMRQTHAAGERLFVDYAGDGVPVVMREQEAHNGSRAHALEPPALRRLDDRAHPGRRPKDRPGDRRLVRADPEVRPHPEQGYRACLGIVRLAGSYGAARVEAAAEHAIEIGARTYGSVKSILDNKLDRRPAPRRPADPAPIRHSNSAGPVTTIEENANVLRHPTIDQLYALGLHGMAKAFAELADADDPKDLAHADWLALLLDKETSWRRDKRLTARLHAAKLRQQANVEDVDYRAARGLDRALFQKLSEGDWIDAHDDLVLVGPAGVGKSWLACAIGHRACRDNRAVLYHRWPKLCGDLALARGDGRHPRLIRALGRADLLILDDFGLEPLDAGARHDLLEILEERYGRRSTIVTSQLPLSAWHEVVGDPTYADAILDRLVHNAHRIGGRRACAAPAASRPKRLDQKPRQRKKLTRPTSAAPRAGSSRYRGAASSGIPGRNHPVLDGRLHRNRHPQYMDECIARLSSGESSPSPGRRPPPPPSVRARSLLPPDRPNSYRPQMNASGWRSGIVGCMAWSLHV